MADHSRGERFSSLDSTLLGTRKLQLIKIKAAPSLGGDPTRADLVHIKGYVSSIWLTCDLIQIAWPKRLLWPPGSLGVSFKTSPRESRLSYRLPVQPVRAKKSL